MAILELKNLTKSFGGVKAVDDVNVEFEQGKITCLIGPNGAGKTTIFNLISGFIKLDSGEIYYKNTRIDKKNPWEIANSGIGRLFQDIRVFNKLTVFENVLTAIPKQTGGQFWESLIFRKRIKRETAENTQKVLELLDFVKLGDKKNDFAENLSYGQQKLLSIARLLAMESDLLLLDEPTAGVHPMLIKSILELIKSLAASGKTVILIEHNINAVLETGDWVYLFDGGKDVVFGSPSEVLNDPTTREIYLGI